MNTFSIPIMGAMVLLLAVLGPAQAHQATELYIPLGQSPGISNKVTHIGAIESVDAQSRSITVSGRTVSIGQETEIYVDRSLLKQRSVTGSFSDLQTGRQVEIRYQDDAARRGARWVKVQIAP